jgi:NADPH:quinone reductase
MQTTQAVRIHRHGGPEVLTLETIKLPPLTNGREIMVKIAFAGLNFVDIYQREGRYPGITLPMMLGIEASGVVERADTNSAFRRGDRVAFAGGAQGAYTHYANVPERALIRVPENVSLKTAAIALEHGLTADMLVHSVANIDAANDRWALVHAAAGGVGQWLVRMLVERGVKVVGVVSNVAKCRVVRELGAHAVLNNAERPWTELEMEASGGIPPQWIFDSVGAATFDDSLALLAVRGHLVLYGAASGPVPTVAIAKIMAKSATFSRPVLPHYMQSEEETQVRADRVFRRVADDESWLQLGALFSLEQAQEAHRQLASRDRQGKLLFDIHGEL